MIIEEEDYLAHYGVLRRSGRYPWGSGGPETNTGTGSFLGYIESLKKKGLSDVEIAKGIGATTTELRAAKSIAVNEQRQGRINQAQALKDKGYSYTAIGEKMGINESSVRSLLAPGAKDRANILDSTVGMLKDEVDKHKFIDIGVGVENNLGISNTRLKTAVAALQEQGYKVHYQKVRQVGTGQETSLKVLTKDDVTGSEVYAARANDLIRIPGNHSENGGRTFDNPIQPPINVDSKRIGIIYAKDGGAKADGVIYVRPGVDDLTLGKAGYAQVRVAVDGTHYLKGMAVYKDDMPKGVDLQFNTNKNDTGNKLDAMKPLKDDPDLPFGAIVRQLPKLDEHGNPIRNSVRSAMNIVNEEGQWDDWSRSLSTQFLSKQSPALAKGQLDMKYESSKKGLEEILQLTNPAVRAKLLQSFSDDADSSAIHMKAAALPRQRTQVILPVNGLKDTEIYAPNFRQGERVVLVRHPHGGPFEIPELTVNNSHPEAKRLLGQAKDAIGINSNVAARLSGADFDGDTVLVIPNNNRQVKTQSALQGLKNFDPQSAYPGYEGMTPISASRKQKEMGVVSNLIADMSIRAASSDDLARAVRHSMVVIDAEKHNLDWKASERANGIPQLKAKYQSSVNESGKPGASTLITRAKSRVDVPDRKARSARDGGAIDKATGEKKYTPTGESFVGRDGKVILKTVKSTKLAETADAHTLSSGTQIEAIYADHSNRMKTLANLARKEMVNTETIPYSPSAKQHYAKEVATLNHSLNVALKNAPRERQAQLLANATIAAKRAANPDMEASELKKVKAQALAEARIRTGAAKDRIKISEGEWAAIQAGAVSNNQLKKILDNTDIEEVKRLATPRANVVMTDVKQARARQMLASGYSQSDIADALGVNLSTLKSNLSKEE